MTQVQNFRDALLGWYRTNRRDLPWRRTADPYAIWLSEVMLQQTQVATVIPYWERFLGRFPVVSKLAAAPLDEVLALWTGLGYYSRARNLHRAAQAMVALHAGRVPPDFDALSALPGVGPYTAAAVASIAFGLPRAVLDGNVARVLCRVRAIPGDDRGPAVRETLRQLAGTLLDPASPSDFNQAMMELGATVCTPRSPACPTCPVSQDCLARQSGEPSRYPERTPRRKQVTVDWSVVLAERDGRILLVRSVSPGLFTGMWELPWLDRRPESLMEQLSEKYGLRISPLGEFARVRHSITFRRVTLHAIRATVEVDRVAEPDPRQIWINPDDLGSYGLSSIARKVLHASRETDRQRLLFNPL